MQEPRTVRPALRWERERVTRRRWITPTKPSKVAPIVTDGYVARTLATSKPKSARFAAKAILIPIQSSIVA